MKIEPHIPYRNEFRILNKLNFTNDDEDTLYFISSRSKMYFYGLWNPYFQRRFKKWETK